MTNPDEYLNDVERHLNTPVYCGQCEFFQHKQTRHGLLLPVCHHPHAWQTTHTFLGAQRQRVPADVRNAQNDCADYRPLDWSLDGLCRRLCRGTLGEQVYNFFAVACAGALILCFGYLAWKGLRAVLWMP